MEYPNKEGSIVIFYRVKPIASKVSTIVDQSRALRVLQIKVVQQENNRLILFSLENESSLFSPLILALLLVMISQFGSSGQLAFNVLLLSFSPPQLAQILKFHRFSVPPPMFFFLFFTCAEVIWVDTCF